MNNKLIGLFLLFCGILLTDNVSAQKKGYSRSTERSTFKDGYTISLELTGFKEGTKFYLLNLDLEKFVDSAVIKNNKVRFSGFVDEPGGFRIHTVDNKYLILELDNSHIKIKGTYDDFFYASIEGSELNRVWTKSRNDQRNSSTERDTLMHKLMATNDSDTIVVRQLIKQLKTIDSNTTQYRFGLIKNEKPSYFTIKELFFLRNSLAKDTLRKLFNNFPLALQETKEGKVIAAYINSNGQLKVGDKFIDIQAKDLNGKPHSLSEIKGKYILLEFWASWCSPCLGEIPSMTSAYNSYKEKGFEIFSFSTDANLENWKKASEKNKLPWKNLSDLNGVYSTVTTQYGIQAIPKNFLINPEGIIVAMDLRGEGLSKTLKEYLDK